MKGNSILRLLAVTLIAASLGAGTPQMQAVVFNDHDHSVWEKEKKKKKVQVPEGNVGAILMLAAVALGGGVLVWRRKQRG